MADKQYRGILADDNSFVRHAVKLCLQSIFTNVVVVGEASDGYDVVRLYHELQPDFVLMDVTMPRMNGIEAARLIIEDNPGATIIALTSHAESAEFKKQLRDAGITQIISKQADIAEIKHALREFGLLAG